MASGSALRRLKGIPLVINRLQVSGAARFPPFRHAVSETNDSTRQREPIHPKGWAHQIQRPERRIYLTLTVFYV